MWCRAILHALPCTDFVCGISTPLVHPEYSLTHPPELGLLFIADMPSRPLLALSVGSACPLVRRF
jgi:hypothetical protein